jgi:long-chain fatty acid transport protein
MKISKRFEPQKRTSRSAYSLLHMGILLTMSTSVSANMGNSPSTYGILPHDVSTAQAMSLFNSQTSAVYYNPAALANDSHSELTTGLFHADHELRAKSLGGSAPANRSSDIIDNSPSQQLLLGLKTDLSDLSTLKHPMYLGFMLGSEKYAQEMLAFSSETSEGGQFLQYDREPLLLSIGFGTKLWRGINIGASMRITLHSDANLYTMTDLQGNTSNERLNVSAKPVFRPIVGLNMNAGDTFCSTQSCWLDNLDVALSHRAYSNARVEVNAEAEIPGTVTSPGLILAITAFDAFQPAITAFGVRYQFGDVGVGLTGEYQQWSRLTDKLKEDTIQDQGNLDFKDIFIPRLGLEYSLTENVTLKTGAAWEESPMTNTTSPDVNYLDTDKLIVGLGFSVVAHRLPDHLYMASPVQFDFGYQFHSLSERDFDLSNSSSPAPYETVRASGDVHVFVGSFTMKF